MKKTQVAMLLAVVAMFAITASAQDATVLSETWSGLEGINTNLGAFNSDKYEGNISSTPYQYEWEAYAVAAGDAGGYGKARPSGDGHSMMLDFAGTTGYGVAYGVDSGWGYPTDKQAAATEAIVTSVTGKAAISANSHYSVEQYFYWPTTTYADGGNCDLCNGGGFLLAPDGWCNLDVTFQGTDETVLWPQESPARQAGSAMGAWFMMRKHAPIYDKWREGYCGCPEAPAIDGDLIRLRVATSEDAGTADSYGTYVDTFVPCNEWVKIKISHDLTNGIARAFGWDESGAPLPWSGYTVATVNDAVPETAGMVGCAPGENPYMVGPMYIDDYEMETKAAGFISGDMDGDEDVDQGDLSVVLGTWGNVYAAMPDPMLQGATDPETAECLEVTPLGGWHAPGYKGDADISGIVDQGDLSVILGSWGDHAPEPATMSLLILGGIGVLIRRRRRA